MAEGNADRPRPANGKPGQSPGSPEGFERLIADISGRFTRLMPEDVDREMSAVLAMLGDYLGVDRCFIFSLSEDESRHVVTYLWTRPGYEQGAVVLGTVVQEGFPWAGEQMLRRRDIVINGLEDLPAAAGAERGYCETVGIRSFLMCPMYSNDMVLGTLGIDAIREHRDWSDQEIGRLRLVGEVIANELIRKHLNLEIQERLEFERLVAQVSSSLLSAPAEKIAGKIEGALARVAGFLGVDRCILLSMDVEKDDAQELHWSADRLKPG